jgi:NADPH:quinone reductase-like Zn-dependent oxidoreductase
MKAVVLTAYGDVGKLELRDVPDPKAEPGAIVVRMAGASINPIDWKMRSGVAKDRFPVQFPAILGRDVAGEVIEVGAGVDTFAVGDSVLGLVWQAYAERVAASVGSWAKLPAGLFLWSCSRERSSPTRRFATRRGASSSSLVPSGASGAPRCSPPA